MAEMVLFALLAFASIGSAVLMILNRNVVKCVLLLVGNLLAMAVLFLTLHAQFLAVVQVTVYAGAIVVLFLFVVMLLDVRGTSVAHASGWQRPAALALSILLLAALATSLAAGAITAASQPPPGAGGPKEIAQLLFGPYLIPFELISVLLLVAAVGAVVLVKGREERL
ncbi:MAG: NADH-quinone oxidoreductase subunit J [Deinococcus sp.]|nr:NADH-quinone oxidoreductase subunit J [Deinococcus sp.]